MAEILKNDSGSNPAISKMEQCFELGKELSRIAQEAMTQGDESNAKRMYALADVQFEKDNELSGNAISYPEGVISWLI